MHKRGIKQDFSTFIPYSLEITPPLIYYKHPPPWWHRVELLAYRVSISVCYIWWQRWDPLPASQCAAGGGVSTRLEEVRLKARAWSEWEQAIKHVAEWVTTVMQAQRVSDKWQESSRSASVQTMPKVCDLQESEGYHERRSLWKSEDRWGGTFCFYYDIITYPQMCIQESRCINETNYPYSIISLPPPYL